MGKPTSKIIETLALRHQPVRYVVTNTRKIVLVTHDYNLAKHIVNQLNTLENIDQYYMRIK